MHIFRRSGFRTFIRVILAAIVSLFVMIIFSSIIKKGQPVEASGATSWAFLISFCVLSVIAFLMDRVKIVVKEGKLEYFSKNKLVQTINLEQYNYTYASSGHFLYLAHWFTFWKEEDSSKITIDCSPIGSFKTKRLAQAIKPYSLNKGVIKIQTLNKNNTD